MPRCVNEIEQICLTVLWIAVNHGSGLGKYCYAPLSFYLEGVKHLCRFFIQFIDSACHFEHPIGQGALAMVDMGHN